MKKLAIGCGAASAILLSIGSAIPSASCSSAGGVFLVLAILFWFLGSKS